MGKMSEQEIRHFAEQGARLHVAGINREIKALLNQKRRIWSAFPNLRRRSHRQGLHLAAAARHERVPVKKLVANVRMIRLRAARAKRKKAG